MDEVLTVAEAARAARVSGWLVLREIERGRLPAVRIGVRTFRIRRADLDAWLRPQAMEESESELAVAAGGH